MSRRYWVSIIRSSNQIGLTSFILDYCDKDGSPRHQFHQEVVTDGDGKTGHKVWVIMGMERLELPVTFASLNEGRERVAKQVLGRLRSQGKKGKGKAQR
jgi:hypothetical protein